MGRESVNMLLQGVVTAMCVAKTTPNSHLLFSFCLHNILSSLRFHFYALLKLKLNWEFSILLFSGL